MFSALCVWTVQDLGRLFCRCEIKSDFDGLVQILHVNHEKTEASDEEKDAMYQGPVSFSLTIPTNLGCYASHESTLTCNGMLGNHQYHITVLASINPW
jgi:hypothetical protein